MKKPIKNFLLVFFVLIMFIFSLNLCLSISFPKKYQQIIKTYSKEFNLPPSLVASIIKAESNFKEDAMSDAGAVGLMQIMPATAKWICEDDLDLKNPDYNIKIGCMYLNYLKTQFLDLNAILAAYNAGPNKVKIWLCEEEYCSDGIKLLKTPYKETNDYIKKVKNYQKMYKKIYGS